MNRDTCGTCAALDEMQALTESEYRENTLVRLSETHQQLDAALVAAAEREA